MSRQPESAELQPGMQRWPAYRTPQQSFDLELDTLNLAEQSLLDTQLP